MPAGEDLSGRISALAIASDFSSGTERDVLYLGAAGGGVWMSSNFTGATPTWTPLSDNVLAAVDPTTGMGAGLIDVGSIAVIPGVANAATTAGQQGTVFVGTGEADYNPDSRYGSGILSAPSGQAFPAPSKQLAAWNLNQFFRHSISKIVADPLDPQKLWAAAVSDGTGATTVQLAAANGLYYSSDGGQTWNEVAGAFQKFGGATITDVDYTVDKNSQQVTLWAGVKDAGGNNGVWASTDEGSSWTQLGKPNGPGAGLPFGAGLDRVALAADHTAGSNTLYAAIAASDATLKNVYRSTDGGRSWTALNPPFADQTQMFYNLAFGQNPGNGRLYLAGNSKVVEWDPGAQKWLDITVAHGARPHADAHAFAFASDGTVYLGTDGGLWRYHPAAAGQVGTWDHLNSAGLQTIQMYGIAQSPSNANVPLASTQDNGLITTTNGGTSWNYLMDGDSWGTRFDPQDGTIAYDLPSDRGVAVSKDGGQTFVRIPLAQDVGQAIDYTALAVNPVTDKMVMVGRSGAVYLTPNAPKLTAGAPPEIQWTAVSPQLDNSTITALSFAPTATAKNWTGFAYVGYSSGKLFRTTSGLAFHINSSPTDSDLPKWTEISGPWGARRITAIAVDPEAYGRAYVTIGAFIDGQNVNTVGQVWFTPDFGAT